MQSKSGELMDNQDKVIEGLTQISSTLLDEVINLKASNNSLTETVNKQKELINVLLENQKSLIGEIEYIKNNNITLDKLISRSVNNIPYELGNGIIPVPKVASFEETIAKLTSSRVSMSRFGDGEFSLMLGFCRQKFQKFDEKLSRLLTDVFNSHDDNFMIAIADNYSALDKYDENYRKDIRFYMTEETRIAHNKLLDLNRQYDNAYISYCYQMSRNEDSDRVAYMYDKIKSIWQDRDVIIVEGKYSRIGVGNNLLENARSIKRILCPPEHAFDKYKEILDNSIKLGAEASDPIFLLFLGPTASALAYDIYKAGFQALDLGHIDIDYELYTKGTKDRSCITNKHINNYNNIEAIIDVTDSTYLNQVVMEID